MRIDHAAIYRPTSVITDYRLIHPFNHILQFFNTFEKDYRHYDYDLITPDDALTGDGPLGEGNL